ncbi:RNA polymerase sigma factor [Rubinisphaera margarita]|uniref:RNA polymerase sigma factor n=1 Tax=Rubinisphaera margarita TaxID=2909586 RepID=UPI001EE92E79|nr:sigma-70 family RNA polymerase sigma factor [Rubinisphaera margarita]MCG6157076.1 sigma-70 family RNA polymerase sigma factor [Rubinisphaera margarita]
MALTEADRELIKNCLQRKPAAWQRFINRFVGVFVHAIRHTAECHSYPLNDADIDEISAEILATIVSNEFQTLRLFRGKSSLATYLAVVSRRVAVKEIAKRRKQSAPPASAAKKQPATDHAGEAEVLTRDQLDYLIKSLSDQEANIVRAYHLDGKSYKEISTLYGVPENSIGPVLSRAREYMRRMA